VFSVQTVTFTPTLPPPAEIPEVAMAAMLPASAIAVAGGLLVFRRRRGRVAPAS
jgi:hypothetical protein